MDQRWIPEPERADYIENMTLGADGAWRSSGGLIPAFTYAGTDPVYSVHWFAQHQGGRQWLVIEREDNTLAARPQKVVHLEYIDFRNNTRVSIDDNRTRVEGPWAGTTFMEHNNWLYCFNGYDKPIRWNGREKVEVGFSQRPAPPTCTVVGFDQCGADYSTNPANYDPIGFQRGVGDFGGQSAEEFLYGYALSHVNDLGQVSPPSDIAWVLGDNPELSGIPASGFIPGRVSIMVEIESAPSNVRGFILWRTANVHNVSAVGQQGAALYRLKEFATGGQVSYADGSDDTELGSQLQSDETGLFPKTARLAKMFKGIMFVDGDGSRLRYSAPALEQFPDVNYIPIGDATTGPITGLKATRNALVVFKQRGIYLVRGTASTGFRADALTEDFGCSAPRSLVEVPGLGTMFLNEDGPHVLIGALENTGTPTRVEPLIAGIAKVWRQRVNTKALAGARATLHLSEGEVWFQVPEGGDDRPSLGLAFNYRSGDWSVRKKYPFYDLTETRGHRNLLFGASHDPANPGVFVVSRGVAPPVPSEYRGAWMDLGGERTIVRNVHIHSLNNGNQVTLEWRVDRESVNWQAGPDVPRLALDSEKTRSKWNEATWDTSDWQETAPFLLRYDLHRANAFEVQWRVTGNDLELTAADVVIVPGGVHHRKA